MPAPAPCATTKHALEPSGAVSSPDTRVAASTSMCTGLDSKLFTLKFTAAQIGWKFRRLSALCA